MASLFWSIRPIKRDMGKRIIQQRRGKGSPTYTAPSHRYSGEINLPKTDKTLTGEVVDIINSVGHSAPLLIVKYEDGQVSMYPAAIGVRVGQKVFAGEEAPAEAGNVIPLNKVSGGVSVYNIENTPFDGGKLVRSTGGAASVIGVEDGKIAIKMPSKRKKIFNPNCRAVVGTVAGEGRTTKPRIKAGQAYHAKKAKGKLYPKVRGIAMNAVDHKHGGTHSRNAPGGGRFSSTRRRDLSPGAKVGLIAAKKTGRGKSRK